MMAQVSCDNIGDLVKGERSPCLKPALSVCKGCFLVQYCSRECQISHWGLHKEDCKSPLMKATWKPSWNMERRTPTFVIDGGPQQTAYGKQKYLWGNVPALDVVNHLQNEKDNLPQNLRVLFAASGDIRNVVKSLAGLPTSYTGQCEIVVNDRDLDIVARNLILLLTTLHFGPEKAAPIMLHIWYSALIPEHVSRSIQEDILPLIQEVCKKIRGKQAKSLQSKTWSYGSRSLRLVLQKAMWDRLPSYFQIPNGLSTIQAQNVMRSTTLAQERIDYLDRALYNLPPPWRVCVMRFRRDGILLPFGKPRTEFTTPNPLSTFYQTKDFWPMMDSANPLEGWPIKVLLQNALQAKNDIYGTLFNYLRTSLLEFCRRLEQLKICFHLFQVDALELPGLMKQSGMGKHYFDRIEVSNIGDRGYLGPRTTLATFGSFLKHKTENPHATLVTLFLNACHEEFTAADHINSIVPESAVLQRYLPMDPTILQSHEGCNADFFRFNDARAMFRDFDRYFDRFAHRCGLEDLGKAVGLEMKSTNSIVEKWPMRLKENATQEEFDLLLGSNHTGAERYVEWRSVA